MKRRWGIAIASGALGLVALAGCGTTASATGTPEDQALGLVGLSSDGTAIPASDTSATPSASTQPGGRHRHVRRYLVHRHRVLHGDVTVRTKNGPVTIAVQRGQVVSVTSTTVTVKSTDGFTETWKLSSDTKVRSHKQTETLNDIKPKETIGIAGRQTGNTDNARLVVIVSN